MISYLIVSLIVALIAIAFDSTYVDQDDLPVVTSGASRDSGSCLCAESSWDRVALTVMILILQSWRWGNRCKRGCDFVKVYKVNRKLGKVEHILKV